MVVVTPPRVPAKPPATLFETTAPTPPEFWQFSTLSEKAMLPRWIRQTLPATAVLIASPRPKSASGAETVAFGEPSIAPGAYWVAPTVSAESEPAPIGTVDS